MDLLEKMKNSEGKRIKLTEKDGTVTTGYVDVYEDRWKNDDEGASILYQCDEGPCWIINESDIEDIEII